tara:strand:- start:5185 stop:5760 length:576 start_codon:yes stop_codon:yes gene_type:complete
VVGNDIVDLKQAALESNWQRKGFLNKVFTQKEYAYIQDSENSFLMVWQLWSMKESAYKINTQQYQHRFFNPKRIVCTLMDKAKGTVKIDNDIYNTFSTMDNAFIYTVATLKITNEIKSNCFKIKKAHYKIQHQTCKNQLKKAISQLCNIKSESISIKKNILGIPKLYKNNQPLKIKCSITHHGNYGAYAIF